MENTQPEPSLAYTAANVRFGALDLTLYIVSRSNSTRQQFDHASTLHSLFTIAIPSLLPSVQDASTSGADRQRYASFIESRRPSQPHQPDPSSVGLGNSTSALSLPSSISLLSSSNVQGASNSGAGRQSYASLSRAEDHRNPRVRHASLTLLRSAQSTARALSVPAPLSGLLLLISAHGNHLSAPTSPSLCPITHFNSLIFPSPSPPLLHEPSVAVLCTDGIHTCRQVSTTDHKTIE
jgi:hypothetical protein